MKISIPFAGMHPAARVLAITFAFTCMAVFVVGMAILILIHAFGVLMLDFIDTFIVRPAAYLRKLFSRKPPNDQTHHRTR